VKVTWTEPALVELEAIYDFLSPMNPAAARRIAEEILLAADSLSLFPYRGRQGRLANTRELVVVRPYLIIYRIAGHEVLILRFWHSAQDPTRQNGRS
jgi:plasmid stabilization system protein ParE